MVLEQSLETIPETEDRQLPPDLSQLGARIDWDLAPMKLQAGDLSNLDQSVVNTIREAAGAAEVVELAESLGLDPIVLVVALIALSEASGNRSAARIARSIIGDRAPDEIDSMIKALHLS